MSKIPSISIFFPAYNDGGTIASMVVSALVTARADRRLRGDRRQRRQPDYTPRCWTSWRASMLPHVRIIHHRSEPRLRRRACARVSQRRPRTGVFYTDGDAQYDPHELTLLAQA